MNAFFIPARLLRARLGRFALAFCMLTPPAGLALAASVSQKPAEPVVAAGAVTRGGVTEGAKIIHITNLDDYGPGSLREAVSHAGPRVIVFDVAGAIELTEDLLISTPFVTIAGQTAPSPGIELRGARMRIGAGNVVVQHLSVRPRISDDPKVASNRDAISVGACRNCKSPMRDIRIENVSASWASDEIIGLWGKALSRVTVRSSLLTEALDKAGHKKGSHSMGLLIGGGVKAVQVVGNLFAHNRYRNPVVGSGASAYVANNFVYDPGHNSVHVYGDRTDFVTRASLIGNVVVAGPSTRGRMTAVQIPGPKRDPSPEPIIFTRDNFFCPVGAISDLCPGARGPSGSRLDVTLLEAIVNGNSMPVVPATWQVMPARDVWTYVEAHAGSRPAERNPTDRRIFAEIAVRSGRIIDNPDEVGGYPELAVVASPAVVPTEPFARVPGRDMTRLEAWLCLKHRALGGAATRECPGSREDFARLLSSQLPV